MKYKVYTLALLCFLFIIAVTLVSCGYKHSAYKRLHTQKKNLKISSYDLVFCTGDSMYRVSLTSSKVEKITKTDIKGQRPNKFWNIVYGIKGPEQDWCTYNTVAWPDSEPVRSPLILANLNTLATHIVIPEGMSEGIIPDYPYSIAIAPDKSTVIVGCQDACYKIDKNGIAEKILKQGVPRLAYSPSGNALALSTGNGVYILSTTDYKVTKHLSDPGWSTWLSDSELVCYAGWRNKETGLFPYSLYNIHSRKEKPLCEGLNAIAVPSMRAVIINNNSILSVSKPDNIKYLLPQFNHKGFSVSPDGKYYAFQEDHHALFNPLPKRSRLRVIVLDDELIARMERKSKYLRPKIIDVYEWPRDGGQFTTISWVRTSK